MTGDTTPISDEARQAAAKALLDEGGGPGNGLHSWRCEYPDRYGPCDCVQEVADLILAAAAPLLVSADSSAQAERLRRERDRWEDEAKGWERHLIAAEVVVEGLRAELAEAKAEAGDEHHTMDELYEYRMVYNAHAARGWLAAGLPVVKSWRHSDGELCFGGGWFIVSAQLPTGQVTNHYAVEHWDLFDVPEVELPPEYDGHTPADAAERLRAALRAAGGQEKPVCPLTEAGIEHRPHHYLTPVPWDCPGLPAAPVGGQDEPSDRQGIFDQLVREGELSEAEFDAEFQRRLNAASWAPRGEPTEAAARTLYRQHLRHWQRGWDETTEAQRMAYRDMAGDILKAAKEATNG